MTPIGGDVEGETVPDRDAAIEWYDSPGHQQSVDIRSVAMDCRFGLFSGFPSPTDDEKDSE